MKRLLSLLLCLLLCLTLLPAAHAEAAAALTAVTEEGDIVLTLSVTEDLNEVCGLHIRFTAPEGFAYDKARPARFHEGFAKTVNTEQLDFVMDSAQSAVDIAAGEPIITLWLTMPDELEPGYYNFRAEIAEAYDWDFGDLPIKGQTVSADYVKPFPPPVFLQQPQSVLAAEGETVSFSAVCDDDFASYRWSCRSGESADWALCTEAGWDTDTLTLQAALSLSGTQYRCEATTRTGSAVSEAATLTVQQAPSIVTQPQSVTAAAGQSVSFTVTAEGTELSYQWYYRTSASGGWNRSSNGTGATLTIEAKGYRSGYQYRCEVTNLVGSAVSEAATLTVLQAPAITAQPQSVSVKENESVSFSVTASGDDLSYQWYYRTSASGSWSKSSNGTESTLTLEAKSYRNGYQYRCEVTNLVGSAVSEAATLSVLKKPAITGQPKSVTADPGEKVSFTVKASGSDLSYQWYYRTSVSGSWSKSSNGTGATLTIEAKDYRNGYQYRCVVSNVYGTLTSGAATLSVRQKPAITSQPQSVTAAAGQSVSFTVTASGSGLSYQWYYRTSASGSWSKSSNGTGATLTIEAKSYRSGYQYRCVVTNGLGSATSSAATLTVQQAPAITSQPQSVTAAAGQSVSFTVKATGDDLSYQWYYRTSASGSWSKSTNGTGATLTIEAKSYRSGYQYRCVVTNSLGSATSSAATLTVK